MIFTTQLQKLGQEKVFSDVAVVYRKSFSNPEDIKALLPFYNAITLQRNAEPIYRVLIFFNQDSVSSIQAGGGMLDDIAQWPQDTPGEATIHQSDPMETIYPKLLAIYQLPAYGGYQIILPDKPLDKAFDPDMANYTQWAFTFSTDVRPGVVGTSFVRLYFDGGRLNKIVDTYNEGNVYN